MSQSETEWLVLCTFTTERKKVFYKCFCLIKKYYLIVCVRVCVCNPLVSTKKTEKKWANQVFIAKTLHFSRENSKVHIVLITSVEQGVIFLSYHLILHTFYNKTQQLCSLSSWKLVFTVALKRHLKIQNDADTHIMKQCLFIFPRTHSKMHIYMTCHINTGTDYGHNW